MKTIELAPKKTDSTKKIAQKASQDVVILTLGKKPVAALLPTAEKLASLSKFDKVIESEESVTITIQGRPIAILQPLVPLVLIEDEEVDLETVALSTNLQFLELIDQSRRHHKMKGGISSEEMRRRLGL